MQALREFSYKKLNSCLSLFSRELGQSFVPHGSGPASAEAKRKLRSRGSQIELAEEFKRGMAISHSIADEDELLDEHLLSLTSSDPVASALLVSRQKEQDVLRMMLFLNSHSLPAPQTSQTLRHHRH